MAVSRTVAVKSSTSNAYLTNKELILKARKTLKGSQKMSIVSSIRALWSLMRRENEGFVGKTLDCVEGHTDSNSNPSIITKRKI